MSNTSNNAKEMLYKEVDKIGNIVLRDAVQRQLFNAPKWFWTAPSSSTGKYHSPDNQLDGGLVIHTIKVIWMGCRLARAEDIPLDPVIAASAIHDTYKFGTADTMELGKDRPQYQQHGLIAAEKFMEIVDTIPTGPTKAEAMPSVRLVYCAVKSHMGRWARPRPRTKFDHLIHYADMCASEPNIIGLPWVMDVELSKTTSSNGRRN